MMLPVLPPDVAFFAGFGLLAWGVYLALDGWFAFRDGRAHRRAVEQAKREESCEALLSEIADLERELDLGRE